MIEIFREIAKREKAVTKFRPYWNFRLQALGTIMTIGFAILTFKLPVWPACSIATISLFFSRWVLIYNQARKSKRRKKK